MKRVGQVVLLTVVVMGLAYGQAVARAADAAGEPAAVSLQGPWRAVSMAQDGRQLEEDQIRQLLLVFSDKTMALRLGSRLVAETAYTIDAKAKPATIDMTFQGQATLGIYQIAGEKLRICLNDLGKGRPAKFPAGASADCDVDLQLTRADRDWCVLWTMNADGSNPRVLLNHPEYTFHGSPEWSGDSKKIAFDAWRSIYGENYVAAHIIACDADGKNFKDLGPGAMPSWSPDGKRIAFSSYDPRGIWIMNADGTGRELIDEGGWGAEWWPKGEKISYSASGGNIRVYDLAKKTSQDLLDGGYRQVYWGMTWSPDGQWLAFKGVTVGNKTELAIVHAEGREKGFRVLLPKALPEVKDIMQGFSWSPDSKQIVVALITQSNPARHLYLLDAEGKVAPKVVPGMQKGRWYNDVAWSPDGKQILYTSPALAR